jgi:hypothetical protein
LSLFLELDRSLSHDLNAPALGAASWPLAEKRHSEMQHSRRSPEPGNFGDYALDLITVP